MVCSHFHKYLLKSHFVLDHSWKESVCVVKDLILAQASWVEKIVWLGWNAEISTLELLIKWSWPLFLSFFLFFCPAQLLCQPSRCPTFTEENECLRTCCPKSSRVLRAKASPELALVTIHEVFHVKPNSFFILWQTCNSKICSFDHKFFFFKLPSSWTLVRAVFLLAAHAEGTAYC